MAHNNNPRPNPFKPSQQVSVVTEVEESVETTDNSEQSSTTVRLMDDVYEEPLKVETAPRLSEMDKLVWIKMRVNHNTIIGGVVYNLQAGKKYRVSKEVRKILYKSPLELQPDAVGLGDRVLGAAGLGPLARRTRADVESLRQLRR